MAVLKINWSMKDWEGKTTKQGDCKICKQPEKLNENNVCLECWLGLDGDTKKMTTGIIEKCCKICMKDFYQKPLKSDTEGFFSDEAIGYDFRNYVVNICPTCKKTPIKLREVQEGRCGRCGCEELKKIEYYTGTPRHRHLRKYTWQHLSEYWEEDKDSDSSLDNCVLTKEIEYCPECLYKKEQNFK